MKPKTESPKTPGGISKSLLTPCRRVGLSRKWKKDTISPFNSPITSKNEETPSPLVREGRKRKELSDEPVKEYDISSENNVKLTPNRSADLPRNKRSKVLLNSLTNDIDVNNLNIEQMDKKDVNEEKSEIEKTTQVATPIRTKSLSKTKKKSPKVIPEKENINEIQKDCSEQEFNKKVKDKSPNNLTKECIVVIQKKIFKKDLIENLTETVDPKSTKTSQTLFDSDNDDVPLADINKSKNNTIKLTKNNNNLETKQQKIQPKNIEIKKLQRTNSKTQPKTISELSDEEDDFFEKKRTILVKKSYNKPVKPTKSKSTGSITQKDIDDLKLRIESKKKMLLAKAMTEDTKEVRELIKKWQKGCQDALMELMDIMKNKLPDNKNMSYSEMLKTLKIPSSLVGYDSDNDCFVTPEDKGIILADLE